LLQYGADRRNLGDSPILTIGINISSWYSGNNNIPQASYFCRIAADSRALGRRVLRHGYPRPAKDAVLERAPHRFDNVGIACILVRVAHCRIGDLDVETKAGRSGAFVSSQTVSVIGLVLALLSAVEGRAQTAAASGTQSPAASGAQADAAKSAAAAPTSPPKPSQPDARTYPPASDYSIDKKSVLKLEYEVDIDTTNGGLFKLKGGTAASGSQVIITATSSSGMLPAVIDVTIDFKFRSSTNDTITIPVPVPGVAWDPTGKNYPIKQDWLTKVAAALVTAINQGRTTDFGSSNPVPTAVEAHFKVKPSIPTAITIVIAQEVAALKSIPCSFKQSAPTVPPVPDAKAAVLPPRGSAPPVVKAPAVPAGKAAAAGAPAIQAKKAQIPPIETTTVPAPKPQPPVTFRPAPTQSPLEKLDADALRIAPKG
jgi:hypothetical protein